MNAINENKRIISEYIDECILLAESGGHKIAVDRLQSIKQRFLNKQILIVTVGEMRRGKSSMLNALLGEAEPVFPVDINVCTNAVTIVQYGEEEQAEVVYYESKGSKKALKSKMIKRQDIANYVSEKGNPKNVKNVVSVTVSLPHPMLKEGVRLVDTPGLGSMNVNHSQTTYGYLPNADLLLFVSDASNGLTETELNFLKKGHKYCKNIIFPLTKKDLNADWNEIAEDNKRKISEAVGVSRDEITVVPVSSTAKQRYLKTQKEAMLEVSNFAELESVVWSSVVEKRAEILFLPYLEEAKSEMLKIADSVYARCQLESGDKKMLEDYTKGLQSNVKRLESLLANKDEWYKDVSHGFDGMKEELAKSNDALKVKLMAQLEESINKHEDRIRNKQEFESTYRELNDLICAEVLEIRAELENKTAETIGRVNKELELDKNVYRGLIEGIKFDPQVDSDVIAVRQGFVKSAKTVLKTRRDCSLTLGVIGGVAGAIIGGFTGHPFIGAFSGFRLGSTVGGWIGTVEGVSEAVDAKYDDVPSAKAALYSYVNSSCDAVSKLMMQALTEVENRVLCEVEDRIGNNIAELRESIEDVKAGISSQKTERERLAKLRTYCNDLYSIADKLAEAENGFAV